MFCWCVDVLIVCIFQLNVSAVLLIVLVFVCFVVVVVVFIIKKGRGSVVLGNLSL